MSKFINSETQVVVSVDDSKDDRFTSGWEPYKESKSTSRKSSSK